MIAYDTQTLTVVTWGRLKKMTWGFMDVYCDEAYAVLNMDFINASGPPPSVFDLESLRSDLIEVTA